MFFLFMYVDMYVVVANAFGVIFFCFSLMSRFIVVVVVFCFVYFFSFVVVFFSIFIFLFDVIVCVVCIVCVVVIGMCCCWDVLVLKDVWRSVCECVSDVVDVIGVLEFIVCVFVCFVRLLLWCGVLVLFVNYICEVKMFVWGELWLLIDWLRDVILYYV